MIMQFNKVVRQISSLEIQGAESIARASVNALAEVAINSNAKTVAELFSELNSAKSRLEKTRPTEPLMRNSLTKLINLEGDSIAQAKRKILIDRQSILRAFDSNIEHISKIGAKLIKDNYIVYTHCHSQTVMHLLKTARKCGKKFVVHNTETRPNNQGRLSAKELAEAKIPVVYFVDAAFVEAIKDANLILLGADAITYDGVYNKVGSKTVVILAAKFNIPVYVCADSMKYDELPEIIEERNPHEVWKTPPKGVKVRDPAFELITPVEITGIISELGILTHPNFIDKINKIRK